MNYTLLKPGITKQSEEIFQRVESCQRKLKLLRVLPEKAVEIPFTESIIRMFENKKLEIDNVAQRIICTEDTVS